MSHRILLSLLIATSLLTTGCFLPGGVHATRLGPDRILTDAEVQKAADKIHDADKLWAMRSDPVSVEKAKALLEESLKLAPHNTQALWRAARVCSWMAERAGDAKDRHKQMELANSGVEYAKHAIAVDTESAEGNYYLALSYAMKGDADNVLGLGLVKPMIAALKRARELDEHLDFSGPSRVMGLIYLNAPPWPTSVGDIEEAIDKLEDAADDHPEYPNNHLALAEAYIKAKKFNDARKRLNRVLTAVPAAGWGFELPGWQKQAQALLDKLPKK